MAIDFWKAQQRARARTKAYIAAFLGMTLLIATAIEWFLRKYFFESNQPSFPYFGAAFAAVTFLYALFNYMMYSSYGGSYVAESMGARHVSLKSPSHQEKRFLNIVEEMSIAAGVPMPSLYIINAKEINAFAAGLEPTKACIAVTQGALDCLSRDELQGVIAHEVGHIYNGDMKIGLQLAAMIAGFFFILYLGFRLINFTSLETEDRKANPILILALSLLGAGAVAWLGGSVLRSMVSREREFLADATGVQFTRNPDGLIGALKKIDASQKSDMPQLGKPYAHLYFSNQSFWGRLFATHPSLEKRISALEGREYFPKEPENDA